ncbi:MULTISPECIES: SDR family NAD(P)-dependent oxidoreductase [unclassified Microbacterium]|uniref:SDR family oxidoreductase n=1 Tax=unclassified Microbacterium TaxID=2609290 RepID=UPI001604E9FD|nr:MULTISPECIES: SDR family NAD(P)-dependent oxidoreductase [unclassified Microbacterium]QNA91634.1 SDR family oxidoreductase [Microbacterium sp. Se63.02b]QYM64814.1 SDR family oxidoreductase [Microbacterium sp. Se5.02b]
MRRALVTGGASGLGQACAARLRDDGFTVTTVDRAGGADAVVDVTERGEIDAFVREHGPFDVLINSAGIVGPNADFADVDAADWERTLAVNLTGTFHMSQAVVPGMIANGWGRIVNIASIAGMEGNPRLTAYSASKAAVIGLTKALGKELALSGVLVNAIAPAVIETPMNATTRPDVLATLIEKIPMRRLGRAEEVAELVAWLASDKCSFSTGAVYDISGGRASY